MSTPETQLLTVDHLLGRLSGEFSLDERDIKIVVRTKTEGGFAFLGKAPELAFNRVKANLAVARGQLSGELRIDANAFEVVTTGLSDDDKAKISEQVRVKLLDSSAYPEIVLNISGLSTSFGPDVALVKGNLSLRGVNQRLAVELKRGRNAEFTGTTRILQSEFGVEPLSAFGGLLRSADAVDVDISISLERLEQEC